MQSNEIKVLKNVQMQQCSEEKLEQVMDLAVGDKTIDASNNNIALHVDTASGKTHIASHHTTHFSETLNTTALPAEKNNVTLFTHNNKKQYQVVSSAKISHKKAQTHNRHKTSTNISHDFQKRSGTSGFSGQLYETKLLSLILLRALCGDNIKEFLLGTNIEGVGAFDDIVLRYETNEPQKHKIIFLQAKHKDDPNKDTVNVENIFKQNGDFSLIKYYESFLKIKQKFIIDKNNVMFIDSNKDIECEFIIYTSAQEQFTKKNILEYAHEQSLIKTSQHGKVFQFAYDSQDVEMLVSTVTKSRATLLAKSLSKFILKDNFDNIMAHDCIKIYHVYLAHNVITIESTNSATEETYDYVGKFRDSFWTTKDDNLTLIRRIICKEIAEMKGMTSINQRIEIENVLKSFTFKLPINFGNHLFSFHGSEKKKQRRLEYMCSLLHKLLLSGLNNDSKHTVIKLDDDSVGPGKLVQSKDLENYRLAGLVGNLLVNDDESKMLKFNIDEQSLSKDNIQILRRLKQKYDLCKFRFDINIDSFPKLTLNCKERDRTLVKEFLNKLKFYTNQSKEDEVENVLKQEIKKYLSMNENHIDFLFRVKCDAIYLKVHDKIQKWWQKPHSAPYLTKACKFYQQAKREILDSPLLNIINFITCDKSRNSLLEFDQETIDALKINVFLKSDESILIFVSDAINFSTRKVIQYFEKAEQRNEYIFLDLDFMIIENCFENVSSEVQCSTVSVLIVISQECKDANDLCQKINHIRKLFKGKIIIICHSRLEDNLTFTYSYRNVRKDTKNNYNNLSSKARKIILEGRQVIFQGVKVNVDAVFNNKSLNNLSADYLYKIIHNEELVIGKTLLNTFYNDTINYYVNQSICQYITLNVLYRQNNKYVDKYEERSFFLTEENNDIILVTESSKKFEETCKRNIDKNVHWFIKSRRYGSTIWKQSRGSLQTLMGYLGALRTHQDFTLQLNTLKDIQEKVVIISAEPGMGKSTLLTHVALNTKRLHPSVWILKISLLDNTDQICKWKEHKTDINFIEVMKFLHNTINKNYNSNIFVREKIAELATVNNNNEICLSECDDKYLPGVDLSEIKLFNYFYNNNSLAVLFDGFDEICPDYANEVIQLLCVLKASRVAHLWVTTRQYNVLRQLELALGTFSFTLNPLKEFEQKLFLQNVWAHRLGLDRQLNTKCKSYVDIFYSVITTVLNDINGDFLKLPLHLNMISEIYQPLFKDYFDGRLSNEYFREITGTNLITLYEKFTTMKFDKIRFGEKKHSMNHNDPDIRKMIEKERKMFVENHKKLAAYLLLKRPVIEFNIKDLHELIENINSGEEKTGIIEYMLIDRPKFVHFTFAEYFAVEFLFDKLNAVNCSSDVWKYFINHILISDEHGIRRFINCKLQTDQHLISNLRSNEEIFNTVFSVLLAQDISRGTAIHYAVQEELDFINLFLLQCVKPHLNKDNIHLFTKIIKSDMLCPFCFAIIKRKPSIVKFIIEMYIDIGCKLKDLFYNHRYITFEHVLAYDACPVVFHIVLNAWSQYDPELMVDFFTVLGEDSFSKTNLAVAHQLASRVGLFERYLNYFLNLNRDKRVIIFSVKDSEGQLPAHYAAKQNCFKFFTAMDHLLGRKEFRKMCTTPDNHGFTPVNRFPCNNLVSSPTNLNKNETHYPYQDEIQKVLDKVYGEPGIDVEDSIAS